MYIKNRFETSLNVILSQLDSSYKVFAIKIALFTAQSILYFISVLFSLFL